MQVLTKKPLCFEIEEETFLSVDRIDVPFFHPKYIGTDLLLKESGFPLKKLGEISKMIKDGPHHTPQFVEDGVIFLQKGDVKEGEIDFERPKRVSWEFHINNPDTQAHPRDILIRKIGVGPREAAVVPENAPALHIFVTLALIRLKDEYNPYYVEIFLNSSLGRAQTERRNKGVGSPCLHLEDLKEVLIPLPPKDIQEKIVAIMLEARSKRKENLEKAEELRKELDNFFLKELDLTYPEEKEETVFIANLKDRLDPYYYHPKFCRIIESLNKGKFELKRLKDVVEFSNEQIDPKREPNRVFKYIQIQNVDEENHKISSYTHVLGKEAPGRAKMLIREGDILLPVLGGSLKSVAIVSKEFDREVATNGFAVLRVKDENLRYFMFYYLTTKFAQLQIERNLTGAIMPSVSKSELRKILIPMPDLETQKRIAKKVQEVENKITKLLIEAEEVINIAKEKVEKIILGEDV